MQNDKPPNATRIANKLGPPPRTRFFFLPTWHKRLKSYVKGYFLRTIKWRGPNKRAEWICFSSITLKTVGRASHTIKTLVSIFRLFQPTICFCKCLLLIVATLQCLAITRCWQIFCLLLQQWKINLAFFWKNYHLRSEYNGGNMVLRFSRRS